ncbi:MAG: uroporphyrinogen decarboxylase family protein [bacterium]
MNNRERVLATLNHKRPDKTPYNIEFTKKAHAKMGEFYKDPSFASKLGNCLTKLSSEPKDSWKEKMPNIWEDQFGVQWNRNVDKDIGVVCNCMVTPENINEYNFPNPEDPSRYEKYNEILKTDKDEFFVVDIGFSLFERAWTLAGTENLLMAMITNKDFVHLLFDEILDFNLEIIKNACSFNIDAMMFGDDWGQQTDLIMGPQLWGEFIKPRIKKMYGLAKSKGKFVFIHSCGKVDQLFPDLIECGLDVFNPFQPEVMDVFDMKKKYGNSLSFYGGISTQKTLPYGTVDQVRDEVKQLLDVIGKDGGYIAAPAHAIPPDAKPENIAAMIETLQNQ